MDTLRQLVFGDVAFETSEEHLEFQYKFLCVVMLASAAITGLLVFVSASGSNPIDPEHVRSMNIFTAGSILFWLALRGRKAWFLPVAWGFQVLCVLEYVSALYYVSVDELRAIWFMTNIPGVYLLLGQRAGFVVTLGTALGLSVFNADLPSPYSPNALATLVSGVIFLGFFFHFYADRSISYFVRMRDSNKQLYYMAMHDQLTEVFNARAYYQVCDCFIAQSQRSSAAYAVLFIDLDHFKSINDTHGHAVGDVVLRKAAECIRKSLRASDIVGRVGGEEFSVFLPNANADGAFQAAENIRKAIEALSIEIAPERSLKITASIGVAVHQQPDQTMQEIQSKADLAMYSAKKSGRNRVSSFSGAPA
ncbi:GGDEF domain-containing protein [uncultured Propionivibrio sp.]|uniref:GGDEF domain-containing protein n=1 Tax=uncultured Propionivibrio sp. TaxID=426737 RepID=UPI0029BFDDE2|nr:GGDEF domain-containing protein [uncultured Propionivibrio sp.]